jgi:hypothetical protein
MLVPSRLETKVQASGTRKKTNGRNGCASILQLVNHQVSRPRFDPRGVVSVSKILVRMTRVVKQLSKLDILAHALLQE